MLRVISKLTQWRGSRLRVDGHPGGVVVVVQRFQRIVLDQPLGRDSQGGELAPAIHPELPGIGCPGEQGGVRGIQADHEGAHIPLFGSHLRGEGGGHKSLLGGRDGSAYGPIVPGVGHDAVLGGPGSGGQSGDGGGGKRARQVAAVGKMCSFRQNVTQSARGKLVCNGIPMVLPHLLQNH